jgi:hypothetical protein
MKIMKQRYELPRFDRFGDMRGKRHSNPDTRARHRTPIQDYSR